MKTENGTQKIEIYNLANEDKQPIIATLTSDWRIFSFSSKRGVRIRTVYSENYNNVYLKNAYQYKIAIMDSSKDFWNCGTDRANSRCDSVNDGKFFWSGNYLVENQGRSLIDSPYTVNDREKVQRSRLLLIRNTDGPKEQVSVWSYVRMSIESHNNAPNGND